jgi:hypothetical protein
MAPQRSTLYGTILTYLFFLFMKFCQIYNFMIKIKLIFFPSQKVVEPSAESWYCYCRFEDGKYTPENYKESYYSHFFDVKSEIYESQRESPTLSPPSGIIIYKFKTAAETSNYIVQFARDNIDPATISRVSYKPSIIFADYTHPELDDPITFEHISFYCIVGNVLFTPEFVYRYLRQSVENIKSVPFDEKYQIVAMNEKTDVFYINYDEYMDIAGERKPESESKVIHF